ncbi:MAG TPA: metal-dependent hydrolase [Longimicrobiales bacterium]|nr:metal-dependent hydrolase [Longimicrobiales bacterium]
MPSPLVHSALGAAIYRLGFARRAAPWPRVLGVPPLLVACVGLSLLPDLDAAVGIAFGDMERFHNNLAGSPAFGFLVALVSGGAAALVKPQAGMGAFLLTLVCYWGHVLLDYLTFGRGVMLLWPFSTERFSPPFPLFYGVRWSDGLLSAKHLITLVTESTFLLALWLGLRRGVPCPRGGHKGGV